MYSIALHQVSAPISFIFWQLQLQPLHHSLIQNCANHFDGFFDSRSLRINSLVMRPENLRLRKSTYPMISKLLQSHKSTSRLSLSNSFLINDRICPTDIPTKRPIPMLSRSYKSTRNPQTHQRSRFANYLSAIRSIITHCHLFGSASLHSNQRRYRRYHRCSLSAFLLKFPVP